MVLINTLDSLPNILQKEEHMKKVLSFVLSVAMVICLMPAMAFAADDDAAPATTATATGLSQFSDADSINKKEAVTVLVGLGIIDGMGDGTFQPVGNLTRAQASKLVATLVKSGDKSDIPAPAADPFTDVVKSYWGAGAIKFGVDNGYINGMGDGTFHPEDQVTTAQLATMLVKLLGYSAVDVNYQWPENAMAWATQRNLFFDVDQKGANDILNRENAAQMIYNALKATDQVKATTTGSESQGVDGVSDYVPVLNTKFDYQNRRGDNTEQLIEKYFPKVTLASDENSEDPFARPVTVWKNGRTKITDEVVKTPILSYTAQEVSTKDVTKANDKLKGDLDGYTAAAEVYINGARRTDLDIVENSDSDNIARQISQLTGNGKLVEVYSDDRDTQITRVVVIDYHLAVAKPDSKEKKIELYETKSLNTKIGEVNSKKSFYNKISSVAKKDFVLVAVKGDEIIDAYIPQSVDDVALTRTIKPSKDDNDIELQNAKAIIGGTEYTSNHILAQVYNSADEKLDFYDTNAVSKDSGTAFTDQYGYLVAFSQAKGIADDWALLVAIFTKESTNDVGEKSEDWNATIVTEDGTVETVPVLLDLTAASTSDDNDENTYNVITENFVDAATRNAVTGAVQNGNSYTKVNGVLVTYDETADGYKFKTTGNKSAAHTGTTNIDSKDSKIDTYYVSSDVSVVKVSMTDNKASKLKVSTSSKLPNIDLTEDGHDNYKYVTKENGNTELVATVYRIAGAESDKTLVRVTADTGRGLYGSSQKPGRAIEYYTDDSTEVQEIVVSNQTTVEKGWYAVKEIKDGMELKTMTEADKTKEKVVDWTVVAGNKVDAAYGNSATLNGVEYEIASDAEIIDLADRDIDSTESLIDEIASVSDDKDADDLILAFSYTVDDKTNKVDRVYIIKGEKKTAGSDVNK
jgi:hypothetical protein